MDKRTGQEEGKDIADAGQQPGDPNSSALPVIDTATLFAGGRELRLVHRGAEYRLRITRQGKLILTK